VTTEERLEKANEALARTMRYVKSREMIDDGIIQFWYNAAATWFKDAEAAETRCRTIIQAIASMSCSGGDGETCPPPWRGKLVCPLTIEDDEEVPMGSDKALEICTQCWEDWADGKEPPVL
jgi:hypothetical protein